MAAAGATYLFQGSNIGPGGVLYDALNVPEMFYVLQKKYLGIPNTVPDAFVTTTLLKGQLLIFQPVGTLSEATTVLEALN